MTDDGPSDDHLIDSINAGDPRAFETLYYRYRDYVYRLAHRFTAHDADALDVLQETFAYLSSKFPGFALTAKLSTFLYPVVRNLSIAAQRKRARSQGGDDALDFLPAPAPTTSPRESRTDLTRVLAALAPAQREVVLMRFVDSMTLEEISLALNIPLGTVKSRLYLALAALRDDPRTRNYFS